LETKINVTTFVVSCTDCGRVGHMENVCYRKHGFPSSHENKNFNNSSNKRICIHCGKNGHIIEVCYKNHGFPPGHSYYNGKNNVVNHFDTKENTKD